MLEVQVAEINTWLKEHNLKDRYNIKIVNDPLLGKKIALYEIYCSGTQSIVAQSRSKDKIISYLNMKVNN